MLEGPSVTEIGVGQPNLAMTSIVNITSRYRLMILGAYNNFLDGDTVNCSSKTYFSSNSTVHFWLDKLLSLHCISIKLLMAHATLIHCGEELMNDKAKICTWLKVYKHFIYNKSVFYQKLVVW